MKDKGRIQNVYGAGVGSPQEATGLKGRYTIQGVSPIGSCVYGSQLRSWSGLV